MREIECFDFGTVVKFKAGGIEGVVIGVVVREKSFVYDISYLANGEYKNNYFNEYEFEVEGAEKIKIGFRQNGILNTKI